jgi:hypothetical protein
VEVGDSLCCLEKMEDDVDKIFYYGKHYGVKKLMFAARSIGKGSLIHRGG